MAVTSFSKLTICLFLLSLVLKSTVSDVFTAVIKLEYLARVEERMLDALDTYTKDARQANQDVPDSVLT